jgi:hypothetical protein
MNTNKSQYKVPSVHGQSGFHAVKQSFRKCLIQTKSLRRLSMSLAHAVNNWRFVVAVFCSLHKRPTVLSSGKYCITSDYILYIPKLVLRPIQYTVHSLHIMPLLFTPFNSSMTDKLRCVIETKHQNQ